MRRKDREITDRGQIDEIIRSCRVCRLGLFGGDEVYVVPMSFGYREGVFYFHSAREGRKLDIIKENPRAGFELDCGYEVYGGEAACSFAASFCSVIGTGRAEICKSPEEKIEALKLIMKQQTGKDGWDIPPAAAEPVAIIKLSVETISCKKHE